MKANMAMQAVQVRVVDEDMVELYWTDPQVRGFLGELMGRLTPTQAALLWRDLGCVVDRASVLEEEPV